MKWLFLVFAVCTAIVFLGCRRSSPEQVMERYRAEIQGALPVGTPKEVVEEYFKTNSVNFVFETSDELRQTSALMVQKEQNRFTTPDFLGRYHAFYRDVGKSDLVPYSIWTYVYIDSSGRVSATDLGLEFTGL